MARRIGRSGSEPLPDVGEELLGGPWGDFRMRCALCRRLEAELQVGEFSHGCGQHRAGPMAGFHGDATPCLSRYGSPERREASWWSHRDDLLARFEVDRPGARPWAWWVYEAGGVCRCRPPCALPDGVPWPDLDVSARWLDAHGLLTARERAHLPRAGEVGG
jgi:hypothetical protein